MKKPVAVVFACLMVALLASLPVLAGCGGGTEPGVKEIKYGWDWDFGGRASKGTTELLTGMVDYFKMLEDTNNPLPGVKVKVLTYDGRSEPARVLAGYIWLKGQGVDLMSCAPHDVQMLRPQFEADKIPFFTASTMNVNLDSKWEISETGSPEAQLDVIMQWIIDNWKDYATRKPKVGFVGLAGIPFYESQRDTVVRWAQTDHPDKFELGAVEMAPSSTTAWAAEILKLKTCDYIIVAMSGPPLASFIIEARTRGVTSVLAGPYESALAFWGLVRGAVSESLLDGIISAYYYQWWNQDVPVIKQVKEWAAKYHSQKELSEFYLGTGVPMGWGLGMMLEDAVRRAVAKVGAENVDGAELLQALQDINMTVEGFSIPWKVSAKANCIMRGVRLLQYKTSAGDWTLLQDWKVPAVLAD